MCICHSQQTLQSGWQQKYNIGNKSHFLFSIQSTDTIYFFQLCVHKDTLKEAAPIILPGRQARIKGNKVLASTPSWNELKKYKFIRESKINLYDVHGNIVKCCNNIHFPRSTWNIATFSSKLRKLCVEMNTRLTPSPPLQTLSGLRKLITNNKCKKIKINKAHLYIHSNKERLLSFWVFLALTQSRISQQFPNLRH